MSQSTTNIEENAKCFTRMANDILGHVKASGADAWVGEYIRDSVDVLLKHHANLGYRVVFLALSDLTKAWGLTKPV